MGRRVFKKVISGNGTVTSHQRFIYRGYLQIACVDLTRPNHPCLWLITWDPTQPIATRPLAIQKDGTWYTYGLDLTKNVCEVFGSTGYIATAYTYSPYGSVTATGNVTQPIQWSSEIWDSDLNLVCYNARYYSTNYGRWINRDYAEIDVCFNLLVYCNNSPIYNTDILGLKSECVEKIIITYDTILATSDEVILFDKGVSKRWDSMSNVSFEDDALVAKKRKEPYQIEHPDIIHKKGRFSKGHYYSGNVFKGTIQFIYVDKDREPCSFNMQVGGRAQDFKGVKGDNTALNVNGQIDSTLSRGKTIRGFRVLDTEGQEYIMDKNNKGKKYERKGIFLHKTPIAIPAQPNHIKQLGSHGCFSIPNDEDWKNIVNILNTHNKHCKEKKIDFEIKNNIDFSKPHQSQLDEETRKLINDGKQ